MFTSVVTSAETYSEPQYIPGSGGILAPETKGGLKEYQTVVAVGDSVRTVKVGDLVCVNPERFAVRKYGKNSLKADMEEYTNSVVSYNFHMVRLNGKDHLFLDERDIDFIVRDYEVVEEEFGPSVLKV